MTRASKPCTANRAALALERKSNAALCSGHSPQLGILRRVLSQGLEVRRLIYNDYQAAFQQVDCVLGPTTPSSAFKLGEKLNDPIQMYLEDLIHGRCEPGRYPSALHPPGDTATGLPVGVQLQGHH